MPVKISGFIKRFFSDLSRGKNKELTKVQQLTNNVVLAPSQECLSPHKGLKQAAYSLTPTLKVLLFRVSRNSVYCSLARPSTDLLEFTGLCENEGAM